jgi:hypothetical protein
MYVTRDEQRLITCRIVRSIRSIWILFMNFFRKLAKFDIYVRHIPTKMLTHDVPMSNSVNNRRYLKFCLSTDFHCSVGHYCNVRIIDIH